MPYLSAISHIRRLRGGSQSHLLRASDGNLYVTKFQNNPQHVRVLANEMLATRLGQALGLPMPQVEVIEVPDWLIGSTPELRVETGGCRIRCSTGRQLGLRFIEGEGSTFDYLPDSALTSVRNIGDFARVLVLDKWTCNSDGRQAVFTKSGNHFNATFIDQGYCLNAGEWTFPDSPMRGVYAKTLVYESVTGWDSFEPTLTLAEDIEPDDLWESAQTIPEEWHGWDNEGLQRLTEALYQRCSKIRRLIESFRTTARNPFPNWKQQEALIFSRVPEIPAEEVRP